MRKIFFGVLFIGLCSAFMHEYYVSIFRLTFNKEERQVQGEMKVFTDDLELLLKTKGHGVFALDDKSQKEKIEESLAQELSKSFKYIDAKAKPKELNLVGYENEGDLTWLYFTIDNIKSVKQPTLTINWMTDIFPTQVNIVHFFDGIDERSEYFSLEKLKIEFDFYE